jgi:hypothetical protein
MTIEIHKKKPNFKFYYEENKKIDVKLIFVMAKCRKDAFFINLLGMLFQYCIFLVF